MSINWDTIGEDATKRTRTRHLAPLEYTADPVADDESILAVVTSLGKLRFTGVTPTRVEDTVILTPYLRDGKAYLKVKVTDHALGTTLSRSTSILLDNQCEFVKVETGNFTGQTFKMSKMCHFWYEDIKPYIEPPPSKIDGQEIRNRYRYLYFSIRGLHQERLKWYGNREEDMNAVFRNFFEFFCRDEDARVLDILILVDVKNDLPDLKSYVKVANAACKPKRDSYDQQSRWWGSSKKWLRRLGDPPLGEDVQKTLDQPNDSPYLHVSNAENKAAANAKEDRVGELAGSKRKLEQDHADANSKKPKSPMTPESPDSNASAEDTEGEDEAAKLDDESELGDESELDDEDELDDEGGQSVV